MRGKFPISEFCASHMYNQHLKNMSCFNEIAHNQLYKVNTLLQTQLKKGKYIVQNKSQKISYNIMTSHLGILKSINHR